MNRREVRRFLDKKAKKLGSYAALAEKLTELRSDIERDKKIKISGPGVYQWRVRGVISAVWRDYLEAI